MPKRKKKTASATDIAAKASATVGRSRQGRDSLTRVANPIKVVDTHSRQWNRYSP